MQTITVTHPTGSYPIYLGDDVLNESGMWLAELGYSGRCAVVTNQAVRKHHLAPLSQSLQGAGFEVTAINIPDGEQYKTLGTVADLYDKFIEAELDRSSLIIALGGGVLGDTVGFAAASYLRGVPLVQIPTTLLAMVDSSVGGKTGVDLPQGKNLVGAFKQPEMVIVDPKVLETLPEAEFRAGLAEVVKHGILDAPVLFAALEQGGDPKQPFPQSLLPDSYSLSQMLFEAINVKVRIVQEDPYEEGRRAVLNLGHTFAHALEQLSNYEMRHGEAVAIGIVCAARLATRLGHCSSTTAERIVATLERVGLPTRQPPHPPETVVEAMATDKKRRGGALRFILPLDIGNVDIFDDVPPEEVITTLSRDGL